MLIVIFHPETHDASSENYLKSTNSLKLMAAEKKAKQEIEELKAHIRKMQEAERKERRKLAEEDAIKKIKKNEELIADLQKNLTAQKQVKCFYFSIVFV